MSAFHAAHFSPNSVDHFSLHFLGPVEDEEAEQYEEEAEDDGLGYYEDGVKRTLTDQQIAIFRHSETQALLRKRRHATEAKEQEDLDQSSASIADTVAVARSKTMPEPERPMIGPVMESVDMEDGELEDDSPEPATPASTHTTQSKKKKNKNKNKSSRMKDRDPKPKGFFKQNIKPDLRKRTWDKVETGLEALDYDEMDGGSGVKQGPATQRRRISYDD